MYTVYRKEVVVVKKILCTLTSITLLLFFCGCMAAVVPVTLDDVPGWFDDVFVVGIVLIIVLIVINLVIRIFR